MPNKSFEIGRPLRVCVRNNFQATRWRQILENPAPEGRPSLAQRFSAAESATTDSSRGEPALSEVEGTEFSRTLFRGGGIDTKTILGCFGQKLRAKS